MNTVTLADCGFLKHTRSAYIGGDNIGRGPTRLTWELSTPQQARVVTDELLTQARGHGQVAMLLEPFFLHPDNYLRARDMGFDYVLTHEQTWVDNNERWLWYPAGGSWIDFDQWGLHDKTKDISLLLSNKRMTRGHRLRHEIRERFGSQLDVFGLDKRVTPYEALADYRYSIIVENERADYWFTEKLIDCLSVGTVPIYWGCPEIECFFDGIGILSFANLDQLGNVLGFVGPFDYAVRRPAIYSNLQTAKSYRFCEDYIVEHYPFLFESAT